MSLIKNENDYATTSNKRQIKCYEMLNSDEKATSLKVLLLFFLKEGRRGQQDSQTRDNSGSNGVKISSGCINSRLTPF